MHIAHAILYRGVGAAAAGKFKTKRQAVRNVEADALDVQDSRSSYPIHARQEGRSMINQNHSSKPFTLLSSATVVADWVNLP